MSSKPHWTQKEFRALDSYIKAVKLTGKRARQGAVVELAQALGRSHAATQLQLARRRRGHR